MSFNPLLTSLKLPGQTVRLPSNGIFYKNGELEDNVKNGEIHVFPLNAYHEILLKSPDFLLNGMAVEKVFSDCIPEVKKPLELITKDVDFLFVCLRKVTFGESIEFEYTHYCDKAKKHNYIINISEMLNKTIRIDPTTVDDKFEVKLDNGFVVKTNPLKFNNFITLNQIPSSTLVTPEEKFKYIVESLLTTISSVQVNNEHEVTDKSMIKEWLEKLSANDVRNITSKINDSSQWGPVFSTSCKCKDCNDDFSIDVPVNPVLVFF